MLQEFYVNITGKIPRPLSPARARGLIEAYMVWQVEVPTDNDILRASEIQERHQVSFRDAMIIVAAANAGVQILLSEDMNSGQVIDGILIRNPFVTS